MSDIRDRFFGPENDIKPANVDPTLQAMLDSWVAAILAGRVGFLPRGRQSRTFWYAFAPSTRQRRELLGLLDAWVGPTYSDLDQRRGELDVTDPFDAALAVGDVPPLRFEVLPRAGQRSTQAKISARNSLIMLTRLVNDRPPSQFEASRTTVEVLDDLGHAIAARDRPLARACLMELERSAELDEANLAFLRIRVHAGLRDWEAIFADPALEHVLAMRRPLGVTRAIQSALYFERYLEFDVPGSEPELRASALDLPPYLRDLYTGAPPRSRPEAVVELVSRLLATASMDDSAVHELLSSAPTIQTGLDQHLRRIAEAFAPTSVSTAPTIEAPTSDPVAPAAQVAELMLQGQFAACIELGVATEPSVETARMLVYAARQLSSVEWANRVVDYLAAPGLRESVVATTPVFLRDVEWLESVTGNAQARDWGEWFEQLANSSNSSAREHGNYLDAWEPLSNDEFVALLASASDATLGKLGERGGQFLAAHSDFFDSSQSPQVILRLMAAIALSGKASVGLRSQGLALAEWFAAASPRPTEYEDFLEWTSDLLATNVAATTVSFVCDVLAALTANPAPGREAALTFYFKVIACLRPYRTALDSTDLGTLDVIGSELGVDLPADFLPDELDNLADASADYRYLDGKLVVLHSLTESAITRASQTLRRFLSNIDVRTNSDHVGNPQLAHLSQNADVFVVVTASAKHAATTFIADNRGVRPTVFIHSRGSSAILRALANGPG